MTVITFHTIHYWTHMYFHYFTLHLNKWRHYLTFAKWVWSYVHLT